MMCLSRAISKTRCDVLRCSQRYYQRNRPERSSLIKVAVVGSGSFGDPSALVVKTCDNFVYVVITHEVLRVLFTFKFNSFNCIVHFNLNFRHLFNCGEGTFRMMYSKGHRFRFLSNVFCTSNRWERIGGVPALGRAVFDRCLQFPRFHGPHQIASVLEKFAELTDIDPEAAVSDHTFNSDTYFEDSYMQVDFVDLHRSNGPEAEQPSVMAFVCRLRPRKGTVILSKFTELSLPGEHIQAISKGRDVKLDDGTTIYAKDFLTPGFPGGNFLSE